MGILITIIIISAAILVHEAGHYYCAKLSGIGIAVFSIGFGPRLVGYRHNETDFRISMIPLGGYVMPEMDDEDDYFALAPWRRAFMSLGGPFASIGIALLAVFVVILVESDFHFSTVFYDAFAAFVSLCSFMLKSILGIFNGSSHLSGIVGMVGAGSGYVANNPLNWLKFFAIINLNLGLINLLPLPVLDGGKIAFCLLEKLIPGSMKFQYITTVATWTLLMGLMVFLTYKDIMGLIA